MLASTTEIVESRLLLESVEELGMCTIAEFSCLRGPGSSLETEIYAVQPNRVRSNTSSPIEQRNQRKWVVQKVFLDQSSTVRVNTWSVNSNITFICDEGNSNNC